jgi:hypothetical protein
LRGVPASGDRRIVPSSAMDDGEAILTLAREDGVRTPWHLWAVGGIALLWNGFGAYDYLMTHLQGDAYLRGMGMTDAQMAYYEAMPAWMTAAWAVGVWAAVAATLLLLAHRKLALPLFAASLGGLLVSLLYTYGLTDGGALMGTTGLVMNAVIVGACVFFVWYAWRLSVAGVLR